VKKVDLNVDIGEGFPHDEALLEFATSANVCCGEYAGSWELTTQTIDLCVRKGTRIGCHPGFPDREHFGRRLPSLDEISGLDSVRDQVVRFYKYFEPAYIKPHGAIYQVLCSRNPVTDGIDPGFYGGCGGTFFSLTAGCKLRPTYMLLPNSNFGKVVQEMMSLTVINEGFADRQYREDGSLVPRSEPHAVLQDADEIKKQVLQIAPKVDSICLHGDTPHCLEFAEMVYKALRDAGYEVGY
jgi:UPF0271 protein